MILLDIGHDLEFCRYPLGTEQELRHDGRRLPRSRVRA